MIQSLLNSFRGILLGPVIAKQIIAQKQTELNWEITNEKIIIDLIQKETISPETCQTIISKDEEIISGEFILKILPLILFFHETEYLLSEQLATISKHINLTEEVIQEVVLFRQIINLILENKENLLQNICNLSQSLEKVQNLLNNQTPLTEIKRQFREKKVLNSNYLLLSLYCFARTPDNFKLSILQASQFNHPLILGITAALSGGYNGYSGISIPWRLTMSLDNENNLREQQITQLWKKWVGVDDPFKIIRPVKNQVINPVKINNR
ncbi:ADP-ribosylglycohydrolase family protein [Crocosphaera sp.]|uniref:ADP-ribosylglycohydrolase family protein n=1 Tax=Crocosphaera sp. TaxID=2729996 RepID=UPI00260A7D41|nr:ADP-ribosylglycohydrolase family protein [Crocosphaera sp.]MDJ0582624.1 ADP-ribosylglycohydrolase family protein [Crocosphaera sp.]